MKLDLTQKIMSLDGRIIKISVESPEPLTFREAVLRSLDNVNHEFKVSIDVKYQRGKIQMKIYKDASPDFSVEELSVVKDAIGQFPWTPSVHTILCDLVDQKEEAPPKLKSV